MYSVHQCLAMFMTGYTRKQTPVVWHIVADGTVVVPLCPVCARVNRKELAIVIKRCSDTIGMTRQTRRTVVTVAGESLVHAVHQSLAVVVAGQAVHLKPVIGNVVTGSAIIGPLIVMRARVDGKELAIMIQRRGDPCRVACQARLAVVVIAEESLVNAVHQ